MMKFDGGTGFYSDVTVTYSGNKSTLVGSFKIASFAGDVVQYLQITIGSGGKPRGAILAVSNNFSTLPNRRDKVQFFVFNSAGASACVLISPIGYLNGELHTVFAAYDGDAGTASFRIDGVDADDTGNADRVVPVTATLDAGAGSYYVGSTSGGLNKLTGSLGFTGYDDTGGLTWSNFMQTDGTPKPLDETTWSQWGGVQPLFWHEAGKMDENKGSAGAMTKNGTITLASALA